MGIGRPKVKNNYFVEFLFPQDREQKSGEMKASDVAVEEKVRMCQFVQLFVCLSVCLSVCVFLCVNIHVHLGQPKVENNYFIEFLFPQDREQKSSEMKASDVAVEEKVRKECVRLCICLSVCLCISRCKYICTFRPAEG